MSRRTRADKRKSYYRSFLGVDPVSESLYPHSSEAERHEIAQRLAAERARRAHRESIAERLEQAALRGMTPIERLAERLLIPGMENPRVNKAKAQAELLRRSARVPVALLACADCHRLTTRCICLDAAGQPLQWGQLRAHIHKFGGRDWARS